VFGKDFEFNKKEYENENGGKNDWMPGKYISRKFHTSDSEKFDIKKIPI
jgi:hypothetical protein